MSSRAFGPFVALYVKDVLGDAKLRSLRDDQFGRLVLYWCLMVDNGGTLPKDVRDFAAISRVDVRKVKADFQWLPRFFDTTEDGKHWRSDRLEKEARKYEQKVDRARHNGNGTTPKIGAEVDPEVGPKIVQFDHPEMGVQAGPQNGGVTLTLTNNTPVVPTPKKRKDQASTGDAGLDQYVLAVATLGCAAWPEKHPNGEPMPHASRAALYDRLVALVNEGKQIDQLRGRLRAYLRDICCDPEDPSIAKIGSKAPQFFFGPKGPHRDYENVPAPEPLSEKRVLEALGLKPEETPA